MKLIEKTKGRIKVIKKKSKELIKENNQTGLSIEAEKGVNFTIRKTIFLIFFLFFIFVCLNSFLFFYFANYTEKL